MAKVRKVEALPVLGVLPLRVTERKGTKKRMARIRVKCGCCDEFVDIEHEKGTCDDPRTEMIGINGVNGTKGQWRKILLPLLK